MPKDKEKDKEPEIEAEKTEDADKTVETPPEKKQEKMVPQAQVDKLMADQRRKHREELDAVKGEFADFKKSVEDREKEANDAAEKKVTELRKDLPEGVIRLLDKLTPVEQLEWLSDPANAIDKKHIEPLPKERGDHGAPPRVPVIV
jgi:hypothetical protein